jgi:hypothetical protein
VYISMTPNYDVLYPEPQNCSCGQPAMASSPLCADCRTIAEEKTPEPEPEPPPEPPRPAEVLGDWIRRPCGTTGGRS